MNAPSQTDFPRRLEDILRAFPPNELASLIARLGVAIDASKRIDTAAQLARALVTLPEIRDTSRLPAASVELLHRIAEAGGLLVAPGVPAALEPLAARGIVFARLRPGKERVVELVLPYALLLQLKPWEGEHPRGVRALLAQTSSETAAAIASHYLGRPATPPLSLSLEAAWEVLASPERLAHELERLPALERRLLEAVEAQGGEVETDELLDLEREPMRLRTASGSAPSRRGVGFALERRGLLIPMHPNRHVVPEEVCALVAEASRAARESRRAEIRSFVLDGDHAPRRARFAEAPEGLALALALAIREPGVEVRSGVGTPKSQISRLAARFGRNQEDVALVSALSRALGLWEPAALAPALPPGALTVRELGRALYVAWLRGGAWDEARPEPEVLRVAPDLRDSSPIGRVRGVVLDALRELGEGRWVPWHAIARYVRDDPRTAGLDRLLRRWGDRAGVTPPTAEAVARRVALESLPVLGVVDIGDGEAADDSDDEPVTLRLTARGRALLADADLASETVESAFVDSRVLRVGSSARVAAVLALGALVEIGRVASQLDLVVTPTALARAISAGVESDVVRARIEAVAALPGSISQILTEASVIVGRGMLAPASGFLWVDDTSVRELLRTRKQTSDLFLDPSPPGGLLVVQGVDLERLQRRCRAVGVEVTLDVAAARAKAATSGVSGPASVRGSASTRGAAPGSSRAPRGGGPVSTRRGSGTS